MKLWVQGRDDGWREVEAGVVLEVNWCLDSAVGASAVKLVNPEEQGINSAGENCRSRGALGVRCRRPQCRATGLPQQPPPLYKTSSRHCLTQYVETDLCSSTHIDMHNSSSVHYCCEERGVKVPSQELIGSSVTDCAELIDPLWGMLHLQTPLIFLHWLCGGKALFSLLPSFFLDFFAAGSQTKTWGYIVWGVSTPLLLAPCWLFPHRLQKRVLLGRKLGWTKEDVHPPVIVLCMSSCIHEECVCLNYVCAQGVRSRGGWQHVWAE